MKRLLVVMFVCAAVPLSLADVEKPVVKQSTDEKTLFELMNKDRKKEKLAELVLNPVLCKIARLHSENMAKQEKCEHELDGKRVGQRAEDAGYDYRIIRENLAKSSPEGDDDPPASPPAEIHKKWMESKGHRANILHAKCTEVGLSIVRSKKGTYYYTQVFATPRR